jgi:sRNA-binding carbon storage regulator CsrA
MLNLTWKVGDRIFIGDNLWIRLCEFDGRAVRVQIEGPPSVVVEREARLPLTRVAEIEARIKASKPKKAATSPTN